MGGSCFNENLSFLDGLDDLDFPLADVELNDAEEEDWKAQLQCLEPPFNVLASFSSYLFPSDESFQPRQWPSGSDRSNIVTSNPYDSSEGKYSHTLQTCSPVSVLEGNCSGSSCSAENPIPRLPKFVIPVKRPRSKRSCIRRCKFPLFVLPYASKQYHCLTASELDTEFHAGELTLNSANKRQKKKHNLTRVSSEAEITEPSSELGEARKCAHCQVTKTPQWREGPDGPKTLCNACGVRFRSGRLFPEYRPAASPTFVPSVHSNSHRKVLEIRKKAGQVTAAPAMSSSILSAAECSF